LTFILVFSLSNIVLAEDRSANSVDQYAVSSRNNKALEIMRDHMRSQMDWRSYFTNRMDVQRRARLSEKKLRGQPRTAGVKPLQ
jgi:hypothetical protein